jgi:hypothetical protein
VYRLYVKLFPRRLEREFHTRELKCWMDSRSSGVFDYKMPTYGGCLAYHPEDAVSLTTTNYIFSSHRREEKDKEQRRVMEKLKRQRQLSDQNSLRETQEMQACLREVRGSWNSRNNDGGPAAAAAVRGTPSPQQGKQAGVLQRFEEDQGHKQRKREEEDRKIQQHKDEQRRRADQLQVRERNDSERIREEMRMRWNQAGDGRSRREHDDQAGAARREDRNSNAPNCAQQQGGGGDEKYDEQDYWCYITREPFEDPVEASDGHVYERR